MSGSRCLLLYLDCSDVNLSERMGDAGRGTSMVKVFPSQIRSETIFQGWKSFMLMLMSVFHYGTQTNVLLFGSSMGLTIKVNVFSFQPLNASPRVQNNHT